MTGLWIESWDLATLSNAAISVGSGAEVHAPDAKFTGSASAVSGGAGKICLDQWIGYTPVLSTGAGTLGTNSISGRYRRKMSSTEVFIQIGITTNNTGATSVIATLPFTAQMMPCLSGERRTRRVKP
jgi:hypothetical protein